MANEQTKTYLDEVQKQFDSGQAREHSYRPAMERLMMSFDKVHAVNEPKHSDHGAPDFVFLSDNNNDLILGYAEAKDIGVNLDKTEKTNQMDRYRGYANLILTDYLEFRFFKNGEKYQTISLGTVRNNVLHLTPENGDQLKRELAAFLELPPEKIKSGKRLAQIMGGKARRIRDNVEDILKNSDDKKNEELGRIYEMMKTLLVHDLTEKKFADMYAQTLVYGLFVARYGDTTPDTFTRNEARDLVPKSNPFLHHFFDHIVGPDFVARLGYIVDELCEVFSVSDVRDIVHKHLKIADDTSDAKDPIIHFYEDFLQEYDASERKKMGAYYTPIPVVKFIVRQVDKILKEDFGVSKGLASSETIEYEVDVGQDMRADKRMKANTKQKLTVPRVQVLDPAVGTATFLNEVIKHVHKSFEGQEGRWESYVNDNLLKRLHGFELMMAPYTIAHLKLSMTLKETGVKSLDDRLRVYLTNTLEEGVPLQRDLFSFGLAEAVSEESRLAAEVKSERPVMVVMGNPPYSASSNNKGEYIQNLIKDYKKDLNERKINLDDDYIKFIRFAEDMISKNGEGIIAMITNNSYIDGITHRQMRKHLLQTFDKIYVLDLHGSSVKLETAPDGSKDENVFDIQQGVSIVLMVKKSSEQNKLGQVFHAEIFGKRNDKFSILNDNKPNFQNIDALSPNYFFVPKDFKLQSDYEKGVKINELFILNNTGIQTKNDKLSIQFDKAALESVIFDFKQSSLEDLIQKYNLKTSSGWNPERAQKDIQKSDINLYQILYRPFDKRWSLTTSRAAGFIGRQRMNVTPSMLKDNIGLITLRINGESDEFVVLTADTMVEKGSLPRGNYSIFPLYVYHENNQRTSNFNVAEFKKLTVNLGADVSPESVLDYIYGILHSTSYREMYKEFLKIDFPRVPVPNDDAEFNHFSGFGNRLRTLHLMESPVMDDYETTYPEPGDNLVEKIKYDNGKVYISNHQYFGNVPEAAWSQYVGGYQPAQKWLKDRKSRNLSNDELDHYQRIIKILIETNKIMREIG